MKHFILKRPIYLAGIDTGWGNGYVIIPEGHKLNGVHYDNIHVDVHGGLTFASDANDLIASEHFPDVTAEDARGWVVGFDTAHYGDNLERWPKKAVEAETLKLKKQLENYAD